MTTVLFLDNPHAHKDTIDELRRSFPSLEATVTFSQVERKIEEGNYRIIIIDPLSVRSSYGPSQLVREVIGSGSRVVLAEGALSADFLRLRQGIDYHIRHPKPYNVEELVKQIAEQIEESTQ